MTSPLLGSSPVSRWNRDQLVVPRLGVPTLGAYFDDLEVVLTVVSVLPGDRVVVRFPSGSEVTMSGADLRPVTATARSTDPDTSHDAAATFTGHKLSTHRAMALAALADAGADGLTDFQLAARTGIKQTSIGKRRIELQRAGLVEKTELRRPSDTGTDAAVYRITRTGLADWTRHTGKAP